MSTDWAVTTRALLGPDAAAELWPDHARWTAVVLDARETLRRRARSFWLASTFLSGVVRDDLALVYAFCREVDDTADEPGDFRVSASRLDRLRAELLGQAQARPLVGAFRAAAERRRIPLGSALTLMDGVRSDLALVRIPDEPALLRYCYQVAGTVGLMMCAVLDARPEGRPHAVDLGIAMQLTNIVRDVLEDARAGRVYLPASLLAAEGLDPESVLAGHADPDRLTRILHHLLDLADRYYHSGDEGLRDLPAGHRPAILVASRVYQAIGRRARRPRVSPLRGRVVVPPLEKSWRTGQALGALLSPRVLGLRRRRPHDPSLHHPIAGWPGSSVAAPGER